MFDTTMRIIGDMPQNQREPLIELLTLDLSPAEFTSALLKMQQRVDLSKYRCEIAEALIEATGICIAVPEAYKDFRPVVYDGAFFILSTISQARLLAILNAQFLLGAEAEAGQRLIALFLDIPMLYKLGQIMARNPNIDETFRKSLTMLESGLIHIDISTITRTIEAEIGSELKAQAVELADEVISEASVASVVRFSCRSGQGIFKVVKPDVPCFLDEDLRLLERLAEFYTKNREKYALKDFQFIDTFRDVKFALSKEVDLTNEQRNMKLAGEFYRFNRRIIVPRPMPFSTSKVTAMEFIEGEKITGAVDTDRKSCAAELFNAVVCDCIFAANTEDSLFHADPHAGNCLIVRDAQLGYRIALVDWSQTGILTKPVRASVLKLASGVLTNNHSIILDAVSALTQGSAGTAAVLSAINDSVTPSAGIITGALAFLDCLVLHGVKFPADLLLFRKAIFTLNGVLLSLDPEFDQDMCLINYMLPLLALEMPQRWFNMFFPYADSPFHYRTLMSNAELFTLGAMVAAQRMQQVF